MNERTKQLAEQAGLRFTQLMSNPMVPVVDGKETDLEKFAELIVRECAEVCYHHSWAAGGADTAFGYGYKDCGDDVKRHFGVEE